MRRPRGRSSRGSRSRSSPAETPSSAAMPAATQASSASCRASTGSTTRPMAGSSTSQAPGRARSTRPPDSASSPATRRRPPQRAPCSRVSAWNRRCHPHRAGLRHAARQAQLLGDDGGEVAHALEVHFGEGRDPGVVGPADAQQALHLAGRVDAVFQHQPACIEGRGENGQGQAALGVVGSRRAHRAVLGAAQELGEEVLGSGLAHRPGDPHHGGAQASVVEAGEPPQGREGVGHDDHRKVRRPRAAIGFHQSGDCATRPRLLQEAMTVGARSRQSDEQAACLDVAAVGDHRAHRLRAVVDERAPCGAGGIAHAQVEHCTTSRSSAASSKGWRTPATSW